jgi:hypothetical protein
VRLSQRIAYLESRNLTGPQVWVSIIQDLGKTREEAFAAYEAEHGSIGDKSVILTIIV